MNYLNVNFQLEDRGIIGEFLHLKSNTSWRQDGNRRYLEYTIKYGYVSFRFLNNGGMLRSTVFVWLLPNTERGRDELIFWDFKFTVLTSLLLE